MILTSRFAHKRDARPHEFVADTFEAFLEQLGHRAYTDTGERRTVADFAREPRTPHFFRQHKDGELFSPAKFKGYRDKQSVVSVSVGVLDLDDIDHGALADTIQRLEAYSCAMYTSWQHPLALERDLGRYRVLLELSRPVLLAEWEDFWPRMVVQFGSNRDEACKDASRMYYLPSAPIGSEACAEFVMHPGIPLDVDEVLLRPYPEGMNKPRKTFSLPQRARALRGDPASEAEIAKAYAIVHKQAAAVQNTPAGPIYPTLNAAAFTCGHFIPHCISAEDAFNILLAACVARNPDPDVVDKYHNLINKGLEDGAEDAWWPPPAFPFTESGNAERLCWDYGDRIRFVTDWSKWLVWDGARWAEDHGQVSCYSVEMSRALATSGDNGDESIAAACKKWARKGETAAMRTAVVRLASHRKEVHVRAGELDDDPMLLSCANTTIDLRNGTTHKPDPFDLITKNTGLNYSLDERCPEWDDFLLACTNNDKEKVAFLQRAAGYSLTGSTKEQCLFFLHGSGRNGKGTFVNTLMHAMGDYGGAGGHNLLMRRQGEQHPTERADLYRRRLVVLEEPDAGAAWDEPLVKTLTGSDPIKARRMKEDLWQFWPTHKFWVLGNHKPHIAGNDDGMWRRIRLIPFDVSFKGREDKELQERLKRNELPGILAWAVRGCLAWQQQGLAEPRSVKEATEAYQAEQDMIGAFLAEHCDVGAEYRTTRSAIRSLYEVWCRNMGERFPLGNRRFCDEIRTRGIRDTSIREEGKDPVRGWQGVRVRSNSVNRANSAAFYGGN